MVAFSGLLEIHKVNPPRRLDSLLPLRRYYKDKVTVDEHAHFEPLKTTHTKVACFKRFAARKIKTYVQAGDKICGIIEEADEIGQSCPASSKSVPTKYRGPKPLSWLNICFRE